MAYPFGYGLSYTTFAYSNLTATPNGVTVTVENTGDRAGDEVVQVYIAKPDAKIFRPAQELKGFLRVHLEAGESRTVTIPLDDKAFRYWKRPRRPLGRGGRQLRGPGGRLQRRHPADRHRDGGRLRRTPTPTRD